ncbi:hypothetical protein [Tropicimonas sediminicola]|uniref:Sulfotransferase family protein n=1 Tax=Tropicimonas sediminicola TaxID=1031541 RepID=A0A239I798_9RHOB|nr:hypothetical protein [Tropicimonas sediminicola]SNS88943.1 hypothetical protein SAMN05421757_104228 [Tropicimonas sediminicola]
MKLIVHIGSPKAGSTSIQMGLRNCSEALQAAGITYLSGSREFATLYQRMKRLPTLFATRFQSVEEAEQWSRCCWKELEARLAKEKPAVSVMSGEQFLRLSHKPRFLERLQKSFDEIHAVCYLRDPVSDYVSNINQRIRGGARLRDLFGTWEMNKGMWQAVALECWEEQIGRERLHVRAFDRANLEGGDVVTDFLIRLQEISGLDVPMPERSFRSNESLSGPSTAWLMMLNEAFPRDLEGKDQKKVAQLRKATIDRLREFDEASGAPSLKLEHPAIIAYVRHHTRDGSILVNERYLDGQPKLSVGEPLTQEPTPTELREHVREWLIASLNERYIAEIARAVTLTEEPA